MYIEWLYHERIRASPQGEGDCFDELIQAYKMGILFENRDFCNAILHAIVEVIEEDDDFPTPENVVNACAVQDHNYNLRDLLLDVYMRLLPEKESTCDLIYRLPDHFLRDLLQTFVNNSPAKDKTETMEALRSNLPPRVSSDASAIGS